HHLRCNAHFYLTPRLSIFSVCLRSLNSNGACEYIYIWSGRVCMAFAESSYDTQATHFNPSDGSTDYGIFQINSRYWCSDGKFPGKKECPFTCNQLFSLQNSIACAKIVVQKRTMTAWDGWKAKCRGQNVSKYIAGCGV
uniref:lysozyme n=1 Tax=Astyanax mexicanus TaxID=7994 RepID=A0A3B1K0M9_ASTMX